MGELFSLLTALVWAVAMVLLKRSGESLSPFGLNLFRVSVTSILFLLTLPLMGTPLLLPGAGWEDYLRLFLSGVIAIAISDTLFHKSLNLVGAGIAAVVDCLYPPFTVLLAWIWLGETMGARQLLGMGLVLGGVLAAAWHAPRAGTQRSQLVKGVLLGALAMLTLAIGLIVAKPVLNRQPVVWSTAIRQLSCLAVLLPVAVFSPRRKEYLSALLPSARWKIYLPGAALGSYVALMCWLAGMKYTKVGIAATLNQTSTIYVLLLAALFLKEPLTRRKVAASIVALGGILLVTLT